MMRKRILFATPLLFILMVIVVVCMRQPTAVELDWMGGKCTPQCCGLDGCIVGCCDGWDVCNTTAWKCECPNATCGNVCCAPGQVCVNNACGVQDPILTTPFNWPVSSGDISSSIGRVQGHFTTNAGRSVIEADMHTFNPAFVPDQFSNPQGILSYLTHLVTSQNSLNGLQSDDIGFISIQVGNANAYQVINNVGKFAGTLYLEDQEGESSATFNVCGTIVPDIEGLCATPLNGKCLTMTIIDADANCYD